MESKNRNLNSHYVPDIRPAVLHGAWKNLPYLLPSLAGVLFFYLIPFADVIKRSLMDDMGKKYVGMQGC